MYVAITRWSLANGTDGADKGYANIKPIWAAQDGFHSMSMYDITEGPNKGQRMTVIRFKDKASLEAAREKMKLEIDQLIKDLEVAGVAAEERMQLQEVA